MLDSSELSSIASPFSTTTLQGHFERWAVREADALRASEKRLPAQTIAELRSSGLLALPVPEALGGAGADLSAVALLVRQLAAHAPSTALSVAMPLANAGNTRLCEDAVRADERSLLRSGQAWIAQRALEGKILAVANSERGARGDLANTRSRAVLAGGRVVLHGEKCFATWGPDADYYLCSARSEDGVLDAYFVARDAPGLSLSDDWDALGMRLTASVSLKLEATPVASRFLHPGAIAGVSARHWSTLLLAAVFVGVGEGVLAMTQRNADKLRGYARARLAECALSLEAARAFLELVASEDHAPASAQLIERCRRAKTFAAKTALELATAAITVSGGQAYSRDHSVARFMLDAAAGPLLRPPLPQAMDALAEALFGGAGA